MSTLGMPFTITYTHETICQARAAATLEYAQAIRREFCLVRSADHGGAVEIRRVIAGLHTVLVERWIAAPDGPNGSWIWRLSPALPIEVLEDDGEVA